MRILSAALIGLVLSASVTARMARADDFKKLMMDIYDQYRDDMAALKADRKALVKEQELLRREIRDLEGGASIEGQHELDAACDCVPPTSVGCTQDFWLSKMHISHAQAGNLRNATYGGCVTIYKQFKTRSSEVPASCQAEVGMIAGSARGCGQVRRMIRIDAAQSKLRDLDYQLKVEMAKRQAEILEDRQLDIEDIQARKEISEGKVPSIFVRPDKKLSDDVKSGKPESKAPVAGGAK